MKIECPRIFRNISLIPGPAVDGEARVYLQARLGADVRTIAGQIYGPHCEFGRTLASTFVVEAVPGRAGEACLAQSLVLDPCFWTPEMPFLYDLELTIDSTVYKTSMGLRRWSANGASWSLEARRVVLRGAGTTDSSNETLAQARLAETPLLVTLPSEESLARASRSGVPLLVDLRNVSEQLGETLHQLAWHPAVFGVVLEAGQLVTLSGERYPGLPLGVAVYFQTAVDLLTDQACDFHVAILGADERPIASLSSTGKPVIAIRQGEDYANFFEARAGCDRLQATLSPEFDLAGYFVSQEGVNV